MTHKITFYIIIGLGVVLFLHSLSRRYRLSEAKYWLDDAAEMLQNPVWDIGLFPPSLQESTRPEKSYVQCI